MARECNSSLAPDRLAATPTPYLLSRKRVQALITLGSKGTPAKELKMLIGADLVDNSGQ